MKRKLFFLLLLVNPCFIYSQVNNLKFQTKNDVVLKPNSIVVPETIFDEEPPNPGEEDFMVKMYSYLERVMDSKAKVLITEIEKDYSTIILNKTAEMKKEMDLDKIKRLTYEIESLEKEMKNKKNEIAYIEGLKKEYNFKSRTNGFVFALSKKHRVKNGYDAQVYFNQSVNEKSTKFLSNSQINFGGNGDKISLYNELYSDFYGPFRVSLGALISNKTTNKDTVESQKDAIQRLLGGGGNGIISASYPLLGFNSRYNRLNIRSSFSPKIAFDVPELGTESDKYGFNYDLGVEATIFYSGLLDILTFYTNCRFAKIDGNSVFFDNLGKKNSSFVFNQLSIGLALNSTFRLSWNFYFGSKYVNDNFPSTISFAIIPN